MERIKVASLFCGCGGMDLGVVGGFSYLGKEYTETTKLDKNLHTFNDGTITIEATCTSVGQILYKCIIFSARKYKCNFIKIFMIRHGSHPFLLLYVNPGLP